MEDNPILHANNLLLAQAVSGYAQVCKAVQELTALLEAVNARDGLKLMDAKELAELWGVPDQRIYHLVRTSGLPYVPFGQKQMRFDPVAIRRWLNEGGQVKEEREEADERPGLKIVSR